jgi:hypothetical protein
MSSNRVFEKNNIDFEEIPQDYKKFISRFENPVEGIPRFREYY